MNYQGEGVDKQAQDFYRCQDDFYLVWDVWYLEYMLLVVFFIVEVYYDKGEYCQYQCYGDVVGNVCIVWEERYQAQQVIEQDEEKQCYDKRLEVFVVFFVNYRFGYFIFYEYKEYFKE